MSRQLSTRPAVWMTDSIPEYARMQLAIPTVMIANACGKLDCVTSRTTVSALPRIIRGLSGDMLMKPSAIRFRSTIAATMKIPNVTRAFSRMPMMLSPAIAQMMARMTVCSVPDPSGSALPTAELPLITALTVEMQAVRMYETMIDATATNDAVGPSTKYENEYTPPPRMLWSSRICAISTKRLESTRMSSEVAAMKKIAWWPMNRWASAGA